MNKYMIKVAVALTICISTTVKPGFWDDVRNMSNNIKVFNDGQTKNVQIIPIGPNKTITRCDEYGCTTKKTDDDGNLSITGISSSGTTHIKHVGKYYKKLPNDVLVINEGNGVMNVANNDIVQGTIFIHDNPNSTVVIGNVNNIEYNTNKDGIIISNNVVIPVKAGDRIEEKYNGKVRINGKKVAVKELSKEFVEMPTQEMAVNTIDIPYYLANVHVGGDESKIRCNKAIAASTTFGVTNGKLTASLDSAYKYEGDAPCEVFLKFLGPVLRVNNTANVNLNKQSLEALEVHGSANVSGSIMSPRDDASLRINTYNMATVALQDDGKRDTIALDTKRRSNVSLRNISAQKLTVNHTSNQPLCVSGEVAKQKVSLGQYSQYYAQKLKTLVCDLQASAHSFAFLQVIKELKGTVSKTADVALYGNADVRKLHVSRKASFRRYSGPFE